jgi:hypothetical protein
VEEARETKVDVLVGAEMAFVLSTPRVMAVVTVGAGMVTATTVSCRGRRVMGKGAIVN